MHLESLSIFCDVVRHQSFSRGASASSVSQSAASQAVRQLEQRLGTLLIDRSTRPWRLTPAGKHFFRGCQEIVERYRDLEQEVQRHQQARGHTVRLASIYSVRVHDLSAYVRRFQARVPGADVNLAYMHPDEVYAQVLDDQCDLGLISYANPRRELTVIPWQRQTMVVACPPGHPLAAARLGGVEPSRIAGERFVAFDRGLPVRRVTDRFLRRHGAEVRVVAEFDTVENIKQAVEDGAGIAILPEPTLQQEVDRGTLVVVPLRVAAGTEPLVRPVSIIHRRKRPLNPAVSEFIALLRDEAVAPTPAARVEAAL